MRVSRDKDARQLNRVEFELVSKGKKSQCVSTTAETILLLQKWLVLAIGSPLSYRIKLRCSNIVSYYNGWSRQTALHAEWGKSFNGMNYSHSIERGFPTLLGSFPPTVGYAGQEKNNEQSCGRTMALWLLSPWSLFISRFPQTTTIDRQVQ